MLKITPQKRETSIAHGQTALEYILLLTIVTVTVLAGLRIFLPKMEEAGNIYFNKAAAEIYGNANPCGDGRCNTPFENRETCPIDPCP